MEPCVQTDVRAHRGEKLPVRRLKLLFLAYYFPPLNSTGCVRTWNIAKYLSRLGWDVTVVSPHPQHWRKVNNPKQVELDLDREGIKRLNTGHRWRWLSPWDLKCWNANVGWIMGGIFRNVARGFGIDTLIGWGTEVEKACAALAPGEIDVILASGPPFIGFKLARSLSERLGCPYVLDYRDPWVPRHGLRSQRNTILDREKEIVNGSAAVTSISPSLLNGRLNLGAKLHVVSNGFDPEELSQVRPHEFGHFAIVYTGNFYIPRRVITPVMDALRCLRDRGVEPAINWRFHYYGVHGDHVRQEAKKFGMIEKVVLHGKVSRGEALSAVRGAGVSVVVASVLEEKADQDGGIVTGKLFEAMGLRTPVLFIGPSGSDADVIAQTSGLVRRVTARDVEGMTTYFQEVMSGKVPQEKRPDAYAWPNLITQFDDVLRTTHRMER